MAIEFSLIIPTYNRLSMLRQCLHYLERLRYPRSLFEVIVVDDGSSDGTQDLTERDCQCQMKVLHQANSGTAVARNRGIEAARGLFCLFVDDDVMVHPDLLLEHHRLHTAQPNLVVRGPVINFSAWPCPLEPNSPQSLALEARPLSPWFGWWQRWSGQDPRLWINYSRNYLCTSNASLYRHHLLAAGLFDPSFPRWEDAELAVRLKRLGLKRQFSFQAIVYHFKPPEPWERRLSTAQKDGMSAASLYLRYPSFLTRLRSGLHWANEWRNKLLTAGPWAKCIERAAQGNQSLIPSSLAQNLLLERAYLDAGYRELQRASQLPSQESPPDPTQGVSHE